MNRNQTKNLVFAALCVALAVVLPVALHAVPRAGNILLPMHLPVLLCGMVAGWPFGLACGILSPLLSGLLTGMPPAAYLPSMVCELAVYGLVSGLLSRYVHLGNRVAGLYVQLVGAMLVGRVVFGVLNALIFSAGKYSMELFLTGAFVTALPGIIIQLALLPGIVLLLGKAGLVQPQPQPKKA